MLRSGARPGGVVDVSVRYVDDAESRTLNRQHRGRDVPTNVLSFPAGELPGLPRGAALPLGDLVLCAPLIGREAAEQGKTAAAHWAHLVVHGSLHLLGYEHEQDDDAAQMEALETDILRRLGVDDPYEDRPASTGKP
jgi:probable rRNA maturation factor